MDSIGKLLSHHQSGSRLMKQVTAALIVEAANEELAKFFGSAASSFQAISAKNGTLTVACLSGAAAQALKLQEKTLIQATNNHFKQEVIQKITYLQ